MLSYLCKEQEETPPAAATLPLPLCSRRNKSLGPDNSVSSLLHSVPLSYMSHGEI